MATRVEVTADCADPERLARFWRSLLGYVDHPPPAGFASWTEHDAGAGHAIVDPDGVGPRLFFQRVPEPKVVKNRWHLDVRASTKGTSADDQLVAIAAAAERAVALGARVIRTGSKDADLCTVMADPEGNEFCFI